MATLPSGYTQLTYIEQQKDRSGYIRLGVMTSNTLGFTIVAQTFDNFSTNSGEYGCIFGARQASNSSDFELHTYKSFDNGRFIVGSTAIDAKLSFSRIFTASLSGNTYTIDGNSYTVERNITSSKQLFLFARNNNGSPANYNYGHVRLYRLTFTDSDVVINDFVPCINSSGVVGIYDVINNNFLTSYNSTTFTAGPSVPNNTITKTLYSNYRRNKFVQRSNVVSTDTGFIAWCVRNGYTRRVFITRQRAEQIPTLSRTVALTSSSIVDAKALFYYKKVSSLSSFYGANTIEMLFIPQQITSIPAEGFRQCRAMKLLILGKNITNVGVRGLVYQWNNNQDCCIVVLAETPPTLQSNSISGNGTAKNYFYVPDTSVDTYKAAQYWSSYSSYIIPLSQLPVGYKKYVEWYK